MAPASLSSVSDCSVSMKRNSATGSSKPTTPHSPKRRDSFLSPAAASAAPSLRLVSSSTNGSLHAVVDVVRLLEQRKVIDSALSPVAQDLDRLRPGRLMEATPALVDPPTPMTLRNPACGGGVMVTGGGDGVSELSQSDSNTIGSASMPIKKTSKEIAGRKTPSPVLDKHGTRTNNKMGSTATPSNSLNGDRLLNSQSAIRHSLVTEHRRNCVGDSADISVQKLKSLDNSKTISFGANANSICDERPSNDGNSISVSGSKSDVSKNGTPLENDAMRSSPTTPSPLPSRSSPASFSSPSSCMTASPSLSASVSSSSQSHSVLSSASPSSSSSSSSSISKPQISAPSLPSQISSSHPLSACQHPISSDSSSTTSNSSKSSSSTIAPSTNVGLKCSMPLTSPQAQPTVQSPSQAEPKLSFPATSSSGNASVAATVERRVGAVVESEDQLRRHARLLRRSQCLLRRARKLQGRHADVHGRAELAKLVQNHRPCLSVNDVKPSAAEPSQDPSKSEVTVDSAGNLFLPAGMTTTTDLKHELLQNKDVKNLSTAALVNLVKKLERAQHLSVEKEETSTRPSLGGVDFNLDEDCAQKLDVAASALTCQMSTIKRHLDESDATESSSGGESEEEAEFDSQLIQHYKSIPLHRRSTWKWAKDRAAVAARWTWLHAQVSDLEYRIRQMSELYRSIRASKGAVVLGPSLQQQHQNAAAIASSLLQAVSRRASSPLDKDKLPGPTPPPLSSASSSSQPSTSSPTPSPSSASHPFNSSLNGPSNAGPGRPSVTLLCSSGSENDNSKCDETPPSTFPLHLSPSLPITIPGVDPTCVSARCRPIKSYRRRKLLRMSGLHNLSRKAARPVTLSCSCWPPSATHRGGHDYSSCCAICTGRSHVVQTLDAEAQSLPERLAILDPSFHPVLSFPHDIPLSAQLESVLKSGKIQPAVSSKQAVNTSKDFVDVVASDLSDRLPTSTFSLSSVAAIYSNGNVASKALSSLGGSGSHKEKKKEKSKKKSKQSSVLDLKNCADIPNEPTEANKGPLSPTALEEASTELGAEKGVEVPKKKDHKSITAAELKRQKRRVERLNKKNPTKKARRSQSMSSSSLSSLSSSQNGFSVDPISYQLYGSEGGSRGSSCASSPTPSIGETPMTPTGPLSQSAPSSSLKDRMKKAGPRETSRAYDINNIVIPYSMASSTRVEKLQYKEIITPSWRTLDDSLSPSATERLEEDSTKTSHFICAEEVLPPSPSQSPVPKLSRLSGSTISNGNLSTDINGMSTKVEPEVPRQCNSSPSASPCDPPCSSSSNAIDPPTSEAGNESWVDDGLRETDLDDENSASTTRSRSSHRRISPKSTLVVRRVNEDEEDIEDLSEESIFKRHHRYEMLEKRRYTNFVVPGRRGPRSTRSDSGTNTPDPTSPDSTFHHLAHGDGPHDDNASTGALSPSGIHSPGPAFEDRSMDGFSSFSSLSQVPTSSSAPYSSKRRLPFVSRDRNFSSSSSVSGSTAARLLADYMYRNDDDDDFGLDDDDGDVTDMDDDYDDELSADDDEASSSSRTVYWEARNFPLVEEDLENLGLENGETEEEDVWFGASVRLVDRAARSRFASETAASSPFQKTEVTSRSASLERASTSVMSGAGGDATSVIHQNGDTKIAPPLTPSSTSVEDDDDEDDDNDDDSNDPEWRVDDDRDCESGKKKLKTSDEEMELVNGGEEAEQGDVGGDSVGVGNGSIKRTCSKKIARKGERKCRDKTLSHTINMKNRKKNALGFKLASRR